jgi:hypothetical protein
MCQPEISGQGPKKDSGVERSVSVWFFPTGDDVSEVGWMGGGEFGEM